MKKLYLFLFLGLFSALSSQNKISDTTNYLRNGMFENAKGKIITDNSERIQFQKERNRKIELEKSHLHKGTSTAVEMCTNGGFEQVENINEIISLRIFYIILVILRVLHSVNQFPTRE